MNKSTLLKIAQELVPLIQSGCIAWVGSGLSHGCYEDWGSVVEILCKDYGVEPLPLSKQDLPERLIDKAEKCKVMNIAEDRLALPRLEPGVLVDVDVHAETSRPEPVNKAIASYA